MDIHNDNQRRSLTNIIWGFGFGRLGFVEVGSSTVSLRGSRDKALMLNFRSLAINHDL